MKITVFGIGYVGLVQAAVLAEVGHDVCCVDVDEDKVKQLKQGLIPIFEPGLSPLVKSNVEAGRIHFTTDSEAGVDFGDVLFIAVGTPPDESGAADLSYVLAVAEVIATYMQSSKIIANKSTVPVGTADRVAERIRDGLSARASLVDSTQGDEGVDERDVVSYSVISNPEFLKEGVAVNDCMRPDRIIIGTRSGDDFDTISTVMRELYGPFNRNHDRMIFMDARSAELTKYAANSMLATKISFMNEMANIAERVGADIEQVRQGIGADARIGFQYIYPGCGYGGSCFPKDLRALIRTANGIDYDAQILKAVESVNTRQKKKLFEYIMLHFSKGQVLPLNLCGKVFALWGLAFKPNTDDMREASSRVLMEELWSAGAKVQAFDPEAMEECQRIYGPRDDLMLMGTKEAALRGADALVICTEWQNFRAPDFDLIRQELSQEVIFDGRNLYEPERMEVKGVRYYGIGRGGGGGVSVL
ncbi:MAG: UDP-glucose 6-dehydrogenase [Gammaproteobacteria bacterium]|nr:MAG: UDP-glucose 6-dehydrogenase [Gammaproteobacteria bacterium]